VVTRESAVRVGLVYPELLGTYGDRGNAIVLVERCRRRGIDAELVEVPAGTPIPASIDVYLFGGGEDDPQVMAAAGMRESAGAIASARAGGSVVFAVCAGFQLLGHRYEARDGELLDGLGLVDMTTTAGPSRLIGEVVVEPDPALGLPTLTGFENHGGRSALGPGERPLGTVVVGGGNGVGGGDGVLGERLVGTYLHGPALPRNPALADLMLGWVVGADALTPLDDALVERLRAERLEAATATGWKARLGELRLNRG
jgi:CobQ-like glutamine amidotransferase family enzyme